MSTNKALGTHFIIDLHNCAENLNNIEFIESTFTDIAKKSGATIVKSCFHQFSPHGVTGLLAITESHFAIHTWPEHNFVTVDIFSCSNSIDYQKCILLLEKAFGTTDTRTQEFERGKLNNDIKTF